MKETDQAGLFDSGPALPEGLKYRPDVISREEEEQLVRQVQTLPFKDFEFHGFLGKRRVVSFGWRYDFDDRELQRPTTSRRSSCHCAAARRTSPGWGPPIFSTSW